MAEQTLSGEHYPSLLQLDGHHPYRDAVPEGSITYRARHRRGGRVVYFNFPLAREMGLIAGDHPERMNRTLEAALLETFGLTIINEYDMRVGRRVDCRDLRPNPYMATRYLQLQHPGRSGRTSGDGRSIWNGTVQHRGRRWDVSSCGTGVTRLCPATGQSGEFFPTGNERTDYGCGTASLEEGIGAVLNSELFHRQGIRTERVLAVLSFRGGFAINVRAAVNLLRPSHLFVHLKQNNLTALRQAVDYYIERQIENGEWPALRGNRRYREFAGRVARRFAEMAATFESEYVFCWLDWDGDNILLDGGIIDYGSVRQFGLYHRQYRYDDGPRWSTSLPEQRGKARYIVQQIVQIRDMLIDGVKRPLTSCAADPVLALFDAQFERHLRARLLDRMGWTPRQRDYLLRYQARRVEAWRREVRYLESRQSREGLREVADGITSDALFCLRDLLRELPGHLRRSFADLTERAFLDIGLSHYASRDDAREGGRRRQHIRRFQAGYRELVEAVARWERRAMGRVLIGLHRRAVRRNPPHRITGDALTVTAQLLAERANQLGPARLQQLVDHYLSRTPGCSPRWQESRGRGITRPERKLLEELQQIQVEHSLGL